MRAASLVVPLLVGLYLAGVSTAGLRADTVRLKSGRTYQNVKTVPRGPHQFIITESGDVIRVNNTDIGSLQVHPVRWTRGVPADRLQSLVEEKVRAMKAQMEKELRHDIRREIRAEREAARKTALERERARFARTWRSALVPGWGQYHDGRSGTALLQGSLYAFFLLNFVLAQQSYAEAHRTYADPILPAVLAAAGGTNGILANLFLQEKRSRALNRGRNNTIRYLSLTGGVLAWSVLDAYYAKSDAAPELAVSFGAQGLEAMFQFRVHF